MLASTEVDAPPPGLLLESGPVPTGVFERDELRTIRINAALAALAGISPEAAVGRPLEALLPGLPGLVGLLHTCVVTALPFQFELVAPGPPARRFGVSAWPLEPRRLALVLIELPGPPPAPPPERDPVFQTIFEHAPIGIAAFHWSGSGLRINPAFERLLGYDPGEVSPIGIGGISHPDDLTADVEQFKRLIAGEIERYQLPKRYLRRDGSVLWGLLHVSLARDAAGQPVTAIGMVEDISEARRAEEERDRLIRGLADAVRARDVFLSIASHELKTPLTPLQLNLQLLARRMAATGEAVPPELETARRQSGRLAALVDTLLDVCRIAGGNFELHSAPLDLGDVARAQVEAYRSRAEAAGCALELDVSAAPVRGDRGRLEEVVSNLLSNAIKFGAGQPVAVRAWEAGGRAHLEVRDHGIGIPAQDQRRIFERFERAASVLHYGGLGLGLYIAQKLVEAHGGALRVDSAPGQGATFALELPAAA